MAPARPCSVCGKTTFREDGLCEDCWRARQAIEESLGQAVLAKLVLEAEAEWRMLDRIDNDQRRERGKREP